MKTHLLHFTYLSCNAFDGLINASFQTESIFFHVALLLHRAGHYLPQLSLFHSLEEQLKVLYDN